MMIRDAKKALFIVWFILTLACTAALITPLLFSKETVLKNAPTCLSKSKFNRECALCGSTTAFIEISHANFKAAHQLNRASIFIYGLFFANTCVFVIVAFFCLSKFTF